MRVSPPFLDQDHRIDRDKITLRPPVRRLRRQTMVRCQFAADFRLQRCKFEIAFWVAFDNEINGGIAKIAYPVEQNHRAHVMSLASHVPSPKSQSPKTRAWTLGLGTWDLGLRFLSFPKLFYYSLRKPESRFTLLIFI